MVFDVQKGLFARCRVIQESATIWERTPTLFLQGKYMNDKLLAALVLTKDEALMLYPELDGYYSMMSEAKKFSAKFKTIRERNVFLSAAAKKYFESKLS